MKKGKHNPENQGKWSSTKALEQKPEAFSFAIGLQVTLKTYLSLG